MRRPRGEPRTLPGLNEKEYNETSTKTAEKEHSHQMTQKLAPSCSTTVVSKVAKDLVVLWLRA